MNNVWTAIALRAPCARRQQTKPLLELFNGYARSRRSRSHSYSPVAPCGGTAQTSTWHTRQIQRPSAFSTIASVSARARPPPPAKFDPDVARRLDEAEARPRAERKVGREQTEALSTLRPVDTNASYREGVIAEDEDEGKITWRDYDPEGGMPLPNGELRGSKLQQVFDSNAVDADTGNYILSVLHWRRMSGALIDSGIDFPRGSGVSRDTALRGLQYIRSLDPAFDEQAAGARWAEEEGLRLQEEIQERARSLGIYKQDKDAEYYEGEEMDQGTPEGRERQGTSVLRTHREEREAVHEAEQAEKEAQAVRDELAALHTQRGPLELAGGVQPSVALTTTGPSGVQFGSGPRTAWLPTTVERKPWVKYYEDSANLLKDNVLPSLSTPRRLAPAFLLLLLTLYAANFLSQNYTPPPTSARLWPDTPPAVSTLTAVTLVLGTFFLLGRLPPFWRTLNKYFTIVPASPNPISILGYTLRHDTLSHLAINTLVLWTFGLTLHEDVGRGTFLAILLASGAVGGFTSLTANVLRKNWNTYAFGVSSAAFGVVTAACTLRPNGTLQINGVGEIPFAAWVLAALLGAADVIALRFGLRVGTDHWGHLGGMGAGVIAALGLRMRVAAREDRPMAEPRMVRVDALPTDDPKRTVR
ncbi:hypothetical protein LTR86_005503 [Recurvomyces mirabilis]|nr:hypothetical protein LTR86_005503 [Recurvomyces mirabilis]